MYLPTDHRTTTAASSTHARLTPLLTRRARRTTRVFVAGALLIAPMLFAGFRLAAPLVIRNRLTDSFTHLKNYKATWGTFHVDWSRGGYELKSLTLKPTVPDRLPSIQVDHMRFGIPWSGATSGTSIDLEGATLIFPVDLRAPKPQPLPLGTIFAQMWSLPWREIQVHDGVVVLKIRGRHGHVPIRFEHVVARLDRAPAQLDAAGQVAGGGNALLTVRSGDSSGAALKINFSIEGLSLLEFRALVGAERLGRARGKFKVRIEGTYENGVFNGVAYSDVRPSSSKEVTSRQSKPTLAQALGHAFRTLFKRDAARQKSKGVRSDRTSPIYFKYPQRDPWRGLPIFLSDGLSRSVEASLPVTLVNHESNSSNS